MSAAEIHAVKCQCCLTCIGGPHLLQNAHQPCPVAHTERFVAYHETSAATAHFGMQGYFYFWVILSFVWGLVAAFLAFTLPIWESRFIG